MSDVKESGSDAFAKVESPSKNLTPQRGMAAMSGDFQQEAQPISEKPDLENHSRIKASEFPPRISQELKQHGLDNYQEVLDDNSGKKAEQLTKIVAANQGIPDGSGGYTQFKEVIPGQYNEQGNGIDLVGVTLDGKPVPIEVKKRANADHDSIGTDSVKNLNPETEALLKNIELERHNNPVLAKNLAERRLGEPDTEISSAQMSDLWVRDRWISLVKNHRKALENSGVQSQYLRLDELVSHPYSDAWKQILDSKHTVIVSSNKTDVSTTLLREATLKKGSDVSVIDLTA